MQWYDNRFNVACRISWEMIKLCSACMLVYVTNQVYWLLVVYPTGQLRRKASLDHNITA